MKTLLRIIFFMILSVTTISYAEAPEENSPLVNSTQLYVVIAKTWNSTDAKLYILTRKSQSQSWEALGTPIPVKLGRNGLAKDPGFFAKTSEATSTPFKQEGDFRTPAGIFGLGPAFGFAKNIPNMQIHYLPLTADTVCIDDPTSRFYNKVFDTSEILQPDWHSAEKMRSIPNYSLGMVIRYNSHKIVPGAGSCVFLHVWENSNSPTVGCVATSETDLEKLVESFDMSKEPLILILPQAQYTHYEKLWALPHLTS